MARQLRSPQVVATRLSVPEGEKLTNLCVASQCQPGEVLRLLVRLAELTDRPPVPFTVPKKTPLA